MKDIPLYKITSQHNVYFLCYNCFNYGHGWYISNSNNVLKLIEDIRDSNGIWSTSCGFCQTIINIKHPTYKVEEKYTKDEYSYASFFYKKALNEINFIEKTIQFANSVKIKI